MPKPKTPNRTKPPSPPEGPTDPTDAPDAPWTVPEEMAEAMDEAYAEHKIRTGRPRKPMNLDHVRALAGLDLTEEEMASFFGISPRRFTSRKKLDPAFCQALREGRMHINAALSRTQIKEALKGNVQMLIWLGKNRLHQSDKIDNKVTTDFTQEASAVLDKMKQMEEELLAADEGKKGKGKK